MTIRPQYDAQGTFLGFSAYLGGDWSVAQPYKLLMIAKRDSGSDPVYVPERREFKPWGGYGSVEWRRGKVKQELSA